MDDNFISTNESFSLNISGIIVDISDVKDLPVFEILSKTEDKMSDAKSIINDKAQSVESYSEYNLSESSVRKQKRDNKDINNLDIATEANPADDITSKNPYIPQQRNQINYY